MNKVAFLLVSCCLEPLRTDTLIQVVTNMQQEMPQLMPVITVFDNASTESSVVNLLKQYFSRVFQADRNVGYWTAIWWWLEQLKSDPPDYVYIIESDMIHYDFYKFWDAVNYLDVNPDVGSVRLQKYLYAERHQYDKDRPRHDSYRADWQSHTNHASGQRVVFFDDDTKEIISSTFLTKLPSLNRYETMKTVFDQLLNLLVFSERDFQRLYWEQYQKTAILNGGINHDHLASYGVNTITGSWTNPSELKRIGYLQTRQATIIKPDLYKVARLQ